MKRQYQYGLCLMLCLGLMACSATKDSESTTVAATLNSPSAIMSAVDTTLSSMGSSGFSASSVSSLSEGTSADPRCGEHGTPYSGGNQMDQSNVEYSPTLFYCKLSADLGSPETVRGSLKQLKSV